MSMGTIARAPLVPISSSPTTDSCSLDLEDWGLMLLHLDPWPTAAKEFHSLAPVCACNCPGVALAATFCCPWGPLPGWNGPHNSDVSNTQAPLPICSVTNKVHCVSLLVSESSLKAFLPPWTDFSILSQGGLCAPNQGSWSPLSITWDPNGQYLTHLFFDQGGGQGHTPGGPVASQFKGGRLYHADIHIILAFSHWGNRRGP